MKKLSIRFYEELNDFLTPERVKKRFSFDFFGSPSVKDIIESLGVPHTEVDLILVGGRSVDFSYNAENGDDIAVYPVFESFDIKDVQRLRPFPLRNPKFVLDVHLGKLARLMRLLGLDTFYGNKLGEEEIVEISLSERRTILTKDLGLLKRGKVSHGYWIRNTDPREQIREVLERFDLINSVNAFSRCLECNSLLRKILKREVIEKLPEMVREYCDDYYICKSCNKIFWKGTHYQNMSKTIIDILK